MMQAVRSIEVIARLSESQSHLLDWQTERNDFIPLTGCYSANYQGSLDLDNEVKKFLTDEFQKILLLVGNSGAGKSLYTQGLVTSLWQTVQEGSVIPLWISLPNCKNPEERAIEEVLERCGFDATQIEEIRITQRFIFVLDAYDEIRCLKNVFVTNQLNRWNAKIIVTCRHEYLYWLDNFRNLFTPFEDGRLNYAAGTVLYVKPFSPEQIEQYVKHYIQTHETEWKRWEHYQKAMEKIPGVKELIKTPYLLKLAVESLPDILRRYEAETDSRKKNDLTGAMLYDVFIQRWFARQEQKLKANKSITEQDNIQLEFWRYAKSLAQFMHEHNVQEVFYEQTEESLFDTEVDENPFSQFFDPTQPRLQILQTACLIRETSPNHYAFVHSSLLDYFLSRELYDAKQEEHLLKNDNNKQKEESSKPIKYKDYFNERLFVKEGRVIQFFVDRLKENELFKKEMLARLYASKKNKDNALGASNAITILVKGGETFNSADLMGIQIPGADIRGGYFDQANFEGSNLRNVTVAHAWLRQAIVRNCQLEGFNFGESPWFKCDKKDAFGIRCIDYRPELNRLAIASGKKVTLWNILTGECVKVLEGHHGEVTCVSLSGDGKRVASGSFDWSVRVWDVSTGEFISLRGHEDLVFSVALSADGQRVVSGSVDNTVRLWDISTKVHNVLWKSKERVQTVRCVALSQDGQWVASGGQDDMVRVWDLVSGKCTVLRGHEGSVECVALSSNGQRVVSGGWDKTVRVWELASGESTVWRGHKGQVESVALSANGQRVVSGGGSEDNTVRVWEIESGESTVLLGHAEKVNSVALSMDGQWAASGSQDKTVRIWEVASSDYKVQRKNQDYVRSVALSANGQRMVWGSSDKSVRVWEVNNNELCLMQEKGDEDYIDEVALSADGQRIVSVGGKKLRVWKVSSGESTVLHEHVCCVALSADGQWVASGSLDMRVRVWELTTGECIVLQGHKDIATSVALSADGKWLASGGQDKTVRIWEVKSGISTVLRGYENNVASVALSADGKIVASTNGKRVQVLIVASGELIVLRGHKSEVKCVAMSADGQRVVSGSGDSPVISDGGDNTVRVWDVATQSQLAILRLHSRVVSISLCEDSGLLAISLGDCSVHLWKRTDNHWKSWQLTWSSSFPNPTLNLLDCDFSGSQGLSLPNRRLLDQREAKQDPHWLRAKRMDSPIHQKNNNVRDIAPEKKLVVGAKQPKKSTDNAKDSDQGDHVVKSTLTPAVEAKPLQSVHSEKWAPHSQNNLSDSAEDKDTDEQNEKGRKCIIA